VIEGVLHNWHRYVIGVVAAVLTSAPGVLSVMGSQRWEVIAVRAAYGVPLVWWSRPAATFWACTILILISEVSLAALGLPSGEWAFIPLMAAAFAVGLTGNRRRQIRGVALFVAAFGVAVWVNLLSATPDYRVGLSPFVTIGLIFAGWLFGRETQRVRERVVCIEGSLRRAAFDANEQTRNAVEAERLRIAHDVHDLASHSLTSLVVRTEVAHLRIDAADHQLANEVRAIGDDGRRAMEELRAMLRGIDVGTCSEVSLCSVLSAEVTLSGRRNAITFRSCQQPPSVPIDVADAFKRFVREALMNASRYAPSAPVDVVAQVVNGSIVVSVSNGPAYGLPMPGALPAPTGSGVGLQLTRERLRRCGGTLVANETVNGGFIAVATLPWPSMGRNGSNDTNSDPNNDSNNDANNDPNIVMLNR
jgi:signal transduction histidine kinase